MNLATTFCRNFQLCYNSFFSKQLFETMYFSTKRVKGGMAFSILSFSKCYITNRDIFHIVSPKSYQAFYFCFYRWSVFHFVLILQARTNFTNPVYNSYLNQRGSELSLENKKFVDLPQRDTERLLQNDDDDWSTHKLDCGVKLPELSSRAILLPWSRRKTIF